MSEKLSMVKGNEPPPEQLHHAPDVDLLDALDMLIDTRRDMRGLAFLISATGETLPDYDQAKAVQFVAETISQMSDRLKTVETALDALIRQTRAF
ncbi:hypothetical protein [Tractidigestivibacter sp.]|uniref:hypothetical protein n=1 Tax=Tractidigestivibacter sp. TaxID=2847320 RepID=UPI002A9162EF|nr:hypothetical protein [Tractidigestivibacter sp.]MDY5272293.1 hypothetical protein [Tractidigestivibacter sp.]